MFYSIPEITTQKYKSKTASKILIRQKDLHKLKHNVKSNWQFYLNENVVQKQLSAKSPISS